MNRNAIVVITVLLIASGNAWAQDTEAQKVLKRLQGTYRMIGLEMGDEKLTEDMLRTAPAAKVQMVIKGDRISGELFAPEKDEVATIRLDPSKKPAHIDITVKDASSTEVARGIYEFDGKVLRICLRDLAEEKNRPTEFKPGEKIMLMTFRKQP